jgi:hypothetical protein
MSPEFILTLIAAVGGLLGGMGAFFNGLTSMRIAIRVASLSEHVSEVKSDVAVVKTQTDGMNKAMVELTGTAEHARGMLDQAMATDTKVGQDAAVTPTVADNVTVIGENVTVTKKP